MKLPGFLQIPDTFDPDDRRRRQIPNIILSFFIVAGLFSVIATFSYGDTLLKIIRDPDGLLVLLSSTSVVIVFALPSFSIARSAPAHSRDGSVLLP